MNGFLTALTLGGILGALIAYRAGKAVARAQRAWRDFIATKEAIKGLFRSSASQAAAAAKQILVGIAVIAAIVGFLWIRNSQ